jgi:hypothetical protein
LPRVSPRSTPTTPGEKWSTRKNDDDAGLAASFPAGTAGAAAIYTSYIGSTQIIRKVILRQIAIVNYVNPF